MSVDIQKRNCGLPLQQEFASGGMGMQQIRRSKILLDSSQPIGKVPDRIAGISAATFAA
jgi:hypothetical protein